MRRLQGRVTLAKTPPKEGDVEAPATPCTSARRRSTPPVSTRRRRHLALWRLFDANFHRNSASVDLASVQVVDGGLARCAIGKLDPRGPQAARHGRKSKMGWGMGGLGEREREREMRE